MSFSSASIRAQAPGTARRATAAEALKGIHSLMELPRGTDRQTVIQQLRRVFPALEEMEKQHPKAKELAEARTLAVAAASFLAGAGKDASMVPKAEAIAQKVLTSDAPAEMKLRADAMMLMMKIRGAAASTAPSADSGEAQIRAFVKRYVKTDQAATAHMVGAQIAKRAGKPALAAELEQTLVEKYAADPAARRMLRAMGRSPDLGKPFKATLTKLDGKKLVLPDGLLGKVVVLDFWAMWCGPCVREIPNMKRVYAAYKDKGVEFVGISLDRPGSKDKLREYVRREQMNWIHTFSGKYWSDPTARRYGIQGIPSIWVVGKDGKVFSDSARGNLAETVERALKAATTQPTTRAAAAVAK